MVAVVVLLVVAALGVAVWVIADQEAKTMAEVVVEAQAEVAVEEDMVRGDHSLAADIVVAQGMREENMLPNQLPMMILRNSFN